MEQSLNQVRFSQFKTLEKDADTKNVYVVGYDANFAANNENVKIAVPDLINAAIETIIELDDITGPITVVDGKITINDEILPDGITVDGCSFMKCLISKYGSSFEEFLPDVNLTLNDETGKNEIIITLFDDNHKLPFFEGNYFVKVILVKK